MLSGVPACSLYKFWFILSYDAGNDKSCQRKSLCFISGVDSVFISSVIIGGHYSLDWTTGLTFDLKCSIYMKY